MTAPLARTGPAPVARRIGILGGVGAFFEGVGFVAGTPGVWGLSLVPVLTALVLGALALAGGVTAGLGLARQWAGPGVGLWLLEALFVVAAALASILVALALAQPLSGWALDRLVAARERTLGPGRSAHVNVALSVALPRALAVNLLGLLVGLPVLALLFAASLAFPPAAVVCVPLKLLVGGLVVAWDFLDYPMALRGLGLGARLRWMGAHPGAVLGFAASAGVFLLIPGVGLLVLPMGVAGAATLLRRSEGSAQA